MANNRFNKQVTPKGYQKGGSVKEEPMRDRKKQPLKRKNFKDADPDRKFLKQKQGKKFFEAKAGGRAGKMGGGMMKRPMYKDGGVSTETKRKRNPMDASDMMERRKKQNERKLIEKFKKAGSPKFSKGGSALKPVQPNQKGLKKLPTEVRNKMGFMKKGGVVSDTKKKQFKANKAGQKSFNKKAMKVAKTIGKIVIPGAAATDAGVKLARKFKGTK